MLDNVAAALAVVFSSKPQIMKMYCCFPSMVSRGLALSSVLFTSMVISSAVDPKSSGESDLPTAKVPRINGSIEIDGKANEKAWKNAVKLAPLRLNGSAGKAKEKTDLRVCYDDDALYLFWKCEDRDIQATFTERDSRFWEEEVAEFFVTAEGLNQYFELQWNPLGGVFDAIIHNKIDESGKSIQFEGDWAFTSPGMKHAVHVEGSVQNSSDSDEYWQIEVKIPFKDLGRSTPKQNETWRAGFYRFNRTGKDQVEHLSWSPTRSSSFHEPHKFGYLKFQ
ncbi:MAG TPA: hypothetical protein EYQ50_21670 [Verrucomicrobiales bacterium]|nr:hypothetical protein [Verrucomicrobiales bacterium]